MDVYTFEQVCDVVKTERDYQSTKWGQIDQRGHEVGSWITLMREHLDRAQNDWADSNGDVRALHAIRKVIALGCACGEQHGLPNRRAKE